MGYDRDDGRGRRGPRSYTEAQHDRVGDDVLLHVLPAAAAGLKEQQVMRDLVAILSADPWRDGSQITTKTASVVIDWLAGLPWAEGCEPATPGIYHDRRTEEAGGQLLLVLDRKAPNKGTYAQVLTPQIRAGRPMVLNSEWDRANAGTSGLTEAMRVTGEEYDMLAGALPARLYDRLTGSAGQGEDEQADAGEELARLVAARRLAA